MVLAEVDDGAEWQVFEVLGAESDDFASGCEEGESIFYLKREAAELDTGDHRASGVQWLMWALEKIEIGEGWISVLGMFVILEGLHGRIMMKILAGKVLWVLHLGISRGETEEGVTHTFADASCLFSSCPARSR